MSPRCAGCRDIPPLVLRVEGSAGKTQNLVETKAEREEQTAAERQGCTDEGKMKGVCLVHDGSEVVVLGLLHLEPEEGFHVGKRSSGLILRLTQSLLA